MKGSFIREGNIGTIHSIKQVQDGNNGTTSVCNFSVRFDYQVKTGNDEQPYTDKGGFWSDIEIWGKQADSFYRLCDKGARVLVIGDQVEQTWQDKDTGAERSKLIIKATRVYLALNQRVSAISFEV